MAGVAALRSGPSTMVFPLLAFRSRVLSSIRGKRSVFFLQSSWVSPFKSCFPRLESRDDNSKSCKSRFKSSKAGFESCKSDFESSKPGFKSCKSRFESCKPGFKTSEFRFKSPEVDLKSRCGHFGSCEDVLKSSESTLKAALEFSEVAFRFHGVPLRFLQGSLEPLKLKGATGSTVAPIAVH